MSIVVYKCKKRQSWVEIPTVLVVNLERGMYLTLIAGYYFIGGDHVFKFRLNTNGTIKARYGTC